jgi:GTPase SAR1 family protein
MGSSLSRWYEMISIYISEPLSLRIMILGMDGAGKTTILSKMNLNENVQIMSTIGEQ